MVILMKLLDDIKNFFLPPEDEGYDEAETVREKPARREREYDHDRDRDRERSRERSRDYDEDPEEKRNKVVNISATAQLQVVLVKPEVFTDAKQIADHLIAKKTVVLNLETASAENKRRIIDFLVGVAYANGGSLKPVANLTYIITPYNVGWKTTALSSDEPGGCRMDCCPGGGSFGSLRPQRCAQVYSLSH